MFGVPFEATLRWERIRCRSRHGPRAMWLLPPSLDELVPLSSVPSPVSSPLMSTWYRTPASSVTGTIFIHPPHGSRGLCGRISPAIAGVKANHHLPTIGDGCHPPVSACPRGHPLAANTMSGRPAVARALQAGTHQYAPQSSPADVYALAIREQLAQVSVVDLRVTGLSKAQHFGPCRIRCHVSARRPR